MYSIFLIDDVRTIFFIHFCAKQYKNSAYRGASNFLRFQILFQNSHVYSVQKNSHVYICLLEFYLHDVVCFLVTNSLLE
jgi:hypothetical protein